MAISGVTKSQHPLVNLLSPSCCAGSIWWSSVWGRPTVPEPLIGPVWVPIDVSHLRNPGHHGLKRLKDVSTCEESVILDPADTETCMLFDCLVEPVNGRCGVSRLDEVDKRRSVNLVGAGIPTQIVTLCTRLRRAAHWREPPLSRLGQYKVHGHNRPTKVTRIHEFMTRGTGGR